MESYQFHKNVGQRLRMARVSCHLTQQQMGNLLDVSFQQIQKYELGDNRLASDKLILWAKLTNWHVLTLLGIPEKNAFSGDVPMMNLIDTFSKLDERRKQAILEIVACIALFK